MRTVAKAAGFGALAGCAVGLALGTREVLAHTDLGHGAILLALSRLVAPAALGAIVGGFMAGIFSFPARSLARRLPILPAVAGGAMSALLLVAWAALPFWALVRAKGRPSVVLVSLDTLRADRLGVLGNESGLTPRLDSLAREGAVFEQAISAAPWTLPSHATMFTGRLPFDHGVRWSGSRIQARRATIAEHFSEAGYATAAFTGNAYVSAAFGFDQGFDRFDERDEDRAGGVRAIADAALGWARAHRDRPFFLFVHTYEPHLPYLGVERADPRDRGRLPETFDGVASQQVLGGTLVLDEGERRYVKGLYDGDVARTDAAIGGLLEALRAEGILDDAILVVVSDHGESLWDEEDGRSPDHGHSLHRCLLHVPLFVRAPGRVPARPVTTPVSLVDLAPTLLGLAGLPPDEQHLGRDLAPSLRAGREPEQVPIYAESVEYGPDRFLLRDGRYEVILTPDPTEAFNGVHLEVPPIEAFDHATGGAERIDLSVPLPPEAREVALRLGKRLVAIKRGGPEPTSAPPPALLETLKSLGYVR